MGGGGSGVNKVYVMDSTPLIYLAKASILDRLSGLDADLLIPVTIYVEVVPSPLATHVLRQQLESTFGRGIG